MDAKTRMAFESPLHQGENERIVYSFLSTPWGTTPSVTQVKVYCVTDGYTDVTATVVTGTASVTGDTVSLPVIHSLTKGKVYRVEPLFTASGNTFEPWFEIIAER